MSVQMNPETETSSEPVRKSVTVKGSVDRAFRLFTDGIDTWWPRDHHIGKSPMKRVLIEGKRGGRCYTEQVDGTDCDWGSVLQWDPPHSFVLAWQISGSWQFQPDLAQSSEVEVRFTPAGEGTTRVDLEHRYFERHGAGAAAMRNAVDSPNGWSGTLQRYADAVTTPEGPKP